MQFNGIHHVGLLVKDSQKSLDFYTRGFGGKLVTGFTAPSDSSKTIYLVDLGNNAVVELIPGGTGEEEHNAHWAHLSLCTDNARAAFEKAINAGAVCRREPKESKLGTMAVCNAFVYGPDREIIEFFQIM